VTRNLVKSLTAEPRHQAATWLFLQRNNSQRPLLCLALPGIHIPYIAKFSNGLIRIQQYPAAAAGAAAGTAGLCRQV
jgi:hypothetical protein